MNQDKLSADFLAQNEPAQDEPVPHELNHYSKKKPQSRKDPQRIELNNAKLGSS